jgi:hypothetical protein
MRGNYVKTETDYDIWPMRHPTRMLFLPPQKIILAARICLKHREILLSGYVLLRFPVRKQKPFREIAYAFLLLYVVN